MDGGTRGTRSVRFHDRELEEIEAAAAAVGVAPGTFIRRAAVGAAVRVREAAEGATGNRLDRVCRRAGGARG